MFVNINLATIKTSIMNDNLIYATFEVDNHIQTANFVKDIDETVVKNMHFDDLRKAYEKCLDDETVLKNFTLNIYAKTQELLHKNETEEDIKCRINVINNNSDRIYNREKSNAIKQITDTLNEMEQCKIPMYERRKLVTAFFEPNMEEMVNEGFATSEGQILCIPDYIPDDVFNDIYYLFANAICNWFQFSELDGKYREGLFHCLQFLDHKYHFQNFKIQYPNSSQEDIEKYKRTNILDMITGRDNAYLDINGKHFVCKAFLENKCKFRIRIDEVEYLWNPSNGGRNEFHIDNRELWSCDSSFKVKLDAKNMAFYSYVYEHPYITIDDWFKDMDKFIKDYIEKQDSNSRIKKNILKKEFQKGLLKIISNIKTKVQPKLGTAYIIVNNNGKYYIPISQNERDKPEF